MGSDITIAMLQCIAEHVLVAYAQFRQGRCLEMGSTNRVTFGHLGSVVQKTQV